MVGGMMRGVIAFFLRSSVVGAMVDAVGGMFVK